MATSTPPTPTLELAGVRYYARHHKTKLLPVVGTLRLEGTALSFRGKGAKGPAFQWNVRDITIERFKGRKYPGVKILGNVEYNFTRVNLEALQIVVAEAKFAADVADVAADGDVLELAAEPAPAYEPSASESESEEERAHPPRWAAALETCAALDADEGGDWRPAPARSTRAPAPVPLAPPVNLPATTVARIPETCAATFGGVSVRYAYLSQKGYYPDDQAKANQDAYATKHDFAGRGADAFFGVFDGHGPDGDKCAQYVRKKLPSLLTKAIARAREGQPGGAPEAELGEDATHDVLTRVHKEMNRNLERKGNIDDRVSGTTSVSLYLHGERNRITISNVGDSRAVIGRATKPDGRGALEALALSQDQTPYRLDERVRLRRAGARILTGDQMAGRKPKPVDEDEAARDERLLREGGNKGEGGMKLGEEIDEEGDPPRVFEPDAGYPGCAFSRSIGDSIGTALGVIPDPEFSTVELTPEDKMIVLASDGVFEFMTNQTVVDMCARFEDPLEACRAVTAQAYKLWLQYEVRADDITMICIFVDGLDVARSSTVRVAKEFTTKSSRPLRRGMSYAKSRRILSQISSMSDSLPLTSVVEDFDVESLYSDKTDEQKATIDKLLQACVQFQNITKSQRELIHKVVKVMEVKKGQRIIKQGDWGDCMYIVEDGSFEARILAVGQQDEDGAGGVPVVVYEGSREQNSHPSFGELALLYSNPRAASVVALTDGRLWSLHRHAFKKITAEQEAKKEAEAILKQVDVFSSLTSEQLMDLASYLIEVKYGPGDVVTKEGEVGDAMFILHPGAECKSARENIDGSVDVCELTGNHYVGAEVLRGGDRKYLSTVTATGKTKCWMLQASCVKHAIGSSWNE